MVNPELADALTKASRYGSWSPQMYSRPFPASLRPPLRPLPAWARRLVGVRTLFELSVGIAVLVDVAPLFVTYECV